MKKTRIRIEELNDGSKKYYCEYNNFSWLSFWQLFGSIIGIPFAIVYCFIDKWEQLYNFYDEEKNFHKYNTAPAIFATEQQAKSYLDRRLKLDSEAALRKWNSETKSNTYIKYP